MNSASELTERGSRMGMLHYTRQKQQCNKQTPNPARQPLDEQSLSLRQRHWVSYGNFLLYKLAWFLWFCWQDFLPRALCDMSTPQTFMHVCKCGYVLSFMTFRGFEKMSYNIWLSQEADLAHTGYYYMTNFHTGFHLSFLFYTCSSETE